MSVVTLLLALLGLAALWLLARASACEMALLFGPTEEVEPPVKTGGAERPRDPQTFLGPVLLVGYVATVLLVCCITLLYHRLNVAGWLDAWWMPVLASTVLGLIFGDLLPRAMAVRRPLKVILDSSICCRFAERWGASFFRHMDRLALRWAERLAAFAPDTSRGLAEAEYATMLDIGTREGALHPAEKRLIQRVLGLGRRNLRELMTPRDLMVCLDIETPMEEMRRIARDGRHRRLPLTNGSRDAVVGILNVRSFLTEKEPDMIACVEPPAFVPETMSALELLKSFLRGAQHMAIVVDEFGGVDGLITLEDIVEEIFGEILDEYDADGPLWEVAGPHLFLVQGAAPLPRVSEWLGLPMEANGVDTVGGWLTERLGAIPKLGDSYACAGLNFRVEKMDRFRVKFVLVRDERRPKP